MTIENEEAICRAATARQMAMDLNEAFRWFTANGYQVDAHIEGVFTEAIGYKSIRTPRLSVRVWQEVE